MVNTALAAASAPASQQPQEPWKVHQVKSGESIWTIIRREYPDQKLDMHRAIDTISRMNRLDDPASIKPGMALKMPTLEALQNALNVRPHQEQAPAAASPKPAEPKPLPATNQPYVFKEGDNLWNVVKKHYGLRTSGSVNRAINRVLLENNLENPSQILPGTPVHLPDLSAPIQVTKPQKSSTPIPLNVQPENDNDANEADNADIPVAGLATYTIKPGDNLWKILQERYQGQNINLNTAAKAVLQLNGISDATRLKPGMQIKLPGIALTPTQLAEVKRNKGILENIEAKTQVPWKAMAGIWYRENSCCVVSPTREGGPFQFDPPPSDADLRRMLRKYSTLSPQEIEACVANGIQEFESGGMLAACFLQDKMERTHGRRLSTQSSDEDIKQALFLYNGTGYGTADKSPYVMNGYDDAHIGMRIRGTLPTASGKRIRINRVDPRVGAMTIYKQLQHLERLESQDFKVVPLSR